MSAPLIIGLDVATNTGVCEGRVGDKPILTAHRFRHSRDDTLEDICGHAVRFWADFLRTRLPDLVAIEAPLVVTTGKTNASTVALKAALHGIFAGVAKCKGIRVEIVHFSTWRKGFLGYGNFSGDEAKRACMKLCAQLGWAAPNHDAAESAGVWMHGCSLIAPQQMHRVEPLFAYANQQGTRHA